MKIQDIKQYADAQPDGYGIEVEVEGENLPRLDNAWWKTHDDGSLRGESCEFVTNGSISLENLPKALKSLESSLKRKDSKLNLSFRTSVHVHMNVREMEINKLGSVLYLYYLFEELFMKFCGRERIGNRFCLRLRDSEEIINNLVLAFQGDFSRNRLDPNNLKYAALNIAPIARFGSIEFRAMRGTVDPDTILTWVELINCLKVSKFQSAADVNNYIEVNGYERLAYEVFGGLFALIEFEGWRYDVVRNASLAIELPHLLKERARPNKVDINKALDKMERFFNDVAPAREFDVMDYILEEEEEH